MRPMMRFQLFVRGLFLATLSSFVGIQKVLIPFWETDLGRWIFLFLFLICVYGMIIWVGSLFFGRLPWIPVNYWGLPKIILDIRIRK